MNTKNLNKIFTDLRDYDPQAKPNWEAFIAENESLIQKPAETPAQISGSRTQYQAGLKYAAVLLVAIGGIFSIWYFTGDNLNEVSPENFESQSPSEMQQIISLPDASKDGISQPEKKILDLEIPLIESQSKATVLPDSPQKNISIPLDAGNVNEAAVSTKLEATAEKADEKSEVGVETTDTVVIKKTVFITDTVRIKKALKK